MGVLDQIAKRMALKTANMVEREIPTAAERSVGALVPTKPSGLQQLAGAIKEGKLTAPITNNLEQAVENPSRRSFLKKAAASAARASVPNSIAEPLMSYAAKQALSEAPEVLQKAVSNSGLSLKEALAATMARLKEHNNLAKLQEAARAEAGIADLIEGHQPVLNLLKPDSGITDDEFDKILPYIKAKVGKPPKPVLTSEQKIENSEIRKYNKSVPELQKQWHERYAQFKQENQHLPPEDIEIAHRQYVGEWPWPTYKDLPHGAQDPDWNEIAMSLVDKEKPSTLATGWSGIPEIKHTYVPGVGHYVDPGFRETPYWLKSPDAPLHDDVILQEYLDMLNRYGAE